ncbi:MAG TPA: hypothetical protein VFT74_14285 [Isosphaeraceae bacterium]|nr:hypothetical protein [Isosphaeraceae bacterium]
MIRLTQAVAAVVGSTLSAGVAGGIAGAAVGTFAPSFVDWLQAQGMPGAPRADPAEFGFGLGIVSGLLMGSVVSSILVLGLAFRDAWLRLGGIEVGSEAPV